MMMMTEKNIHTHFMVFCAFLSNKNDIRYDYARACADDYPQWYHKKTCLTFTKNEE